MPNVIITFESYHPIPKPIHDELKIQDPKFSNSQYQHIISYAKNVVEVDIPIIPQIGSTIGGVLGGREIVAVSHCLSIDFETYIDTKPFIYSPLSKYFKTANSAGFILEEHKKFNTQIRNVNKTIENSCELIGVYSIGLFSTIEGPTESDITLQNEVIKAIKFCNQIWA